MANKIIGILKLIFAVLLLPVVIASSFGFAKEIVLLGKPLVDFFLWGIFAFLILYHLIWEPVIVYQKGQRVVEVIFKFFAPLVKIASFCLPIYTLLILIVYWLLSLVVASLKDFVNYFIILASFFLTMHIVFTAKTLKSREADFLKANYFFAVEFIYLISLCLIAGLLNIIFNGFSFLEFFRSSCQNTKDIVSPLFNQLFVVK